MVTVVSWMFCRMVKGDRFWDLHFRPFSCGNGSLSERRGATRLVNICSCPRTSVVNGARGYLLTSYRQGAEARQDGKYLLEEHLVAGAVKLVQNERLQREAGCGREAKGIDLAYIANKTGEQ
jgi:hypothetical protein